MERICVITGGLYIGLLIPTSFWSCSYCSYCSQFRSVSFTIFICILCLLMAHSIFVYVYLWHFIFYCIFKPVNFTIIYFFIYWWQVLIVDTGDMWYDQTWGIIYIFIYINIYIYIYIYLLWHHGNWYTCAHEVQLDIAGPSERKSSQQ